jgi:hypothetical protein
MSDIRPLVVLPYDLEGSNENTNIISTPNQGAVNAANIKETQTEVISKPKRNRKSSRQTNIIKIAVLLANNGAFNGNLQIKKDDGSFNEESDIFKLLNYTQTKVRSIAGMSDLVKQIKLANIDPELIINESIKLNLISNDDIEIIESDPRRKATKRKHVENKIEKYLKKKKSSVNIDLDDNSQYSNNQSSSWEIPFNENE